MYISVIPNADINKVLKAGADYLSKSYELDDVFTEAMWSDVIEYIGNVDPLQSHFGRRQAIDLMSENIIPVSLLLSNYYDPQNYPDDAKTIEELSEVDDCYLFDSFGYENATRKDLVTVADVVHILIHAY